MRQPKATRHAVQFNYINASQNAPYSNRQQRFCMILVLISRLFRVYEASLPFPSILFSDSVVKVLCISTPGWYISVSIDFFLKGEVG